MKVSLFTSARESLPSRVRELTWIEFAAELGPSHTFVSTPPNDHYSEDRKKSQPAFSPAEFRLGAPKLKRNVIRVHFGVLDLDDVSDRELKQVLDATQGLNRILYTTWKHGKAAQKNLWRARLVIEFAQPVPADNWKSFFPNFLARCGCATVHGPAECKDPNHLYFGPYAPKGDEQFHTFEVFPGVALDTQTIPQAPSVALAMGIRTKASRERLEKLALRWKRSKDEFRANMGETLHKVTRGEPFAEPGQRDTSIFQLAQDLAVAMPDVEAISIAEHFAQSLQLMGADAPTVDEVQLKIERAQETVSEEAIAKELAEQSERRIRILEAFSPTTRDYPYTEEELDEFARDAKCSRDAFMKRWIIQRGPVFYLFVAGKYSAAYSQHDVMNAIVRDFAPACSAGVTLWFAPDGIPRRKPIELLMTEYGSVATDHVLDLRAQQARYLGATRTFVEAPCPIRNITPRFDPEVDAWLEIMCGPAYWDVCTWMALATRLDEICVALLFTGKPGTGKSLYAHGMSRLWSTQGPTKLVSAMHGFNAVLVQCPLVFADEQLPKDFRGHGRTAEIREFIADTTRPYNKKFAHEASILGAIRLILAANNEEILAIQENLSSNDIEAIGDRFYHVHVQDEAAAYLQSLPVATRQRFVAGDAIAAHALWLQANYPIVRNGRFAIKSTDREFYRSLTTRTGIRSSVCQWLVSYLKDPRKVDARGDYLVRVRCGQLLVNAQGIIQDWSTYVANENCPPTGRLTQAIAGLSISRMHATRPRGESVKYRVIDPDHLFAWASESEWATREEIEASLALDTEDRKPLTLGMLPKTLTNLSN